MNLEIPHIPVPGEEEPSTPTKEVESANGLTTSSTLPKQQYLSLDKVEYIVVDEADLMLDISFFDNRLDTKTTAIIKDNGDLIVLSGVDGVLNKVLGI